MSKNKLTALTNKQLTKTIVQLLDAMDVLKEQMSIMADTQLLLVQEVGKNNPKFTAKFMAQTLSHDAIRDSFTDFLSEIDAPDEVKLAMTEINEMVIDAKKKYYEEQ